MRFSDYDKRISSVTDLEMYKEYFEEYIANKQKELEDFISRANNRIKWIEECENDKNYYILGRTYRDGKKKSILLIIRYPDGGQRDERYSFDKIQELREKMSELQKKYSDVDWSNFEYEI